MKDDLVLAVQLVPLRFDGFQLVTQFALVLEDQFVEESSICKEYDEDDQYVGQRLDHPTLSF